MTETLMNVCDNETGEVLFVIDRDDFEVGDKLGFNFENAPYTYAVFEIERVEAGAYFVSGPERMELGPPNPEVLQ